VDGLIENASLNEKRGGKPSLFYFELSLNLYLYNQPIMNHQHHENANSDHVSRLPYATAGNAAANFT